MDTTFKRSLSKKIYSSKHEQRTDKLGKVAHMRSIYLALNREKYKQFSFSTKDQHFWRVVAFKSVEFKCDLHNLISLTKSAITFAEHEQNTKDILEMKKKVTYYNLALTTLQKYDENYGKKIGLTLNRLFCKDISHSIREFI